MGEAECEVGAGQMPFGGYWEQDGTVTCQMSRRSPLL